MPREKEYDDGIPIRVHTRRPTGGGSGVPVTIAGFGLSGACVSCVVVALGLMSYYDGVSSLDPISRLAWQTGGWKARIGGEAVDAISAGYLLAGLGGMGLFASTIAAAIAGVVGKSPVATVAAIICGMICLATATASVIVLR